MDAVSPASKLGVLIREAAIDPEIALADDGSGDEEESDTEVDDAADGPAPLDDRPPDLALIEAAAETFHSEFMTRVLQDEDEDEQEAEPRTLRRWPLVAAGGGALVLVGAALALILWWGASSSDDSDGARTTQVDTTALAGHGSAERPAGPKEIHRDDFPPEYVSKTRAKRRRRPRAHRAGHGYLNLNSIPWSRVTIDGKRMPRPTPLLKIRLRTGVHKIVLENRERRLRKQITIRIRSGATTWKVVKLR